RLGADLEPIVNQSHHLIVWWRVSCIAGFQSTKLSRRPSIRPLASNSVSARCWVMVRDQVIQLLQHVSVLAERSGLEVEKLLQRGERVDKAALSHAVETTEILV